MSVCHFIATSNKEIARTKFIYEDIIPTMEDGDMWSGGFGILMTKDMSSAEKSTVSDMFSYFHCYALRSDMGLCYETRYKEIFSPKVARNNLEELLWFKKFIKSLLNKNDMVFVISLDLGYPTDKTKIKTIRLNIDEWELSEEKDFAFKYGIIYQFTKD